MRLLHETGEYFSIMNILYAPGCCESSRGLNTAKPLIPHIFHQWKIFSRCQSVFVCGFCLFMCACVCVCIYYKLLFRPRKRWANAFQEARGGAIKTGPAAQRFMGLL